MVTDRPLLALLVAIIACQSGREEHAPAAAASAPCFDSVETRALACSAGTARRAGDTLTLRVAGGERRFVDTLHGDIERESRYVGRIANGDFSVVMQHVYEGAPEYLIINSATGRERRVNYGVDVSPTGERFIADNPYWNWCEGTDPGGMEVWRLTDSLPVLEWELEPSSCDNDEGWGAVDAHWRSADTIEFARSAHASDHTSYTHDPMTAVRDRDGWRLIGNGAHPTDNPAPIMPFVTESGCADSCLHGTHACRAFLTQARQREKPGTDVIPGDELDVFNTSLIVEAPGVIVFEGAVSNAAAAAPLPSSFQRGDTLYLLEYLGSGRWTWWWHGRPGSARFDWIDSAGSTRSGSAAHLVQPPKYTRWTGLMRLPRGTEGAEVTFVKAEPGMWAKANGSC